MDKILQNSSSFFQVRSHIIPGRLQSLIGAPHKSDTRSALRTPIRQSKVIDNNRRAKKNTRPVTLREHLGVKTFQITIQGGPADSSPPSPSVGRPTPALPRH